MKHSQAQSILELLQQYKTLSKQLEKQNISHIHQKTTGIRRAVKNIHTPTSSHE